MPTAPKKPAPKKSDFPIRMSHPATKGVTHATSPSSLKVLEANGWERDTSKPSDDAKAS